MMITKLVHYREISGTCWRSRSNLLPTDNLQDLKCSREDQYFIEGTEVGTLVPPLAVGFSKVLPHILAVGDEDGALMFYNTNHLGLKAYIHEFLAHNNGLFDLDWMFGESKMLTASGDKTTVLWDVVTENKLAVFKGHSSTIKTVRWRHNDQAVFATGGRDGHLMVYDARMKEKDGHIGPVNCIRNIHNVGHNQKAKAKRKSITAKVQDSQQSVTSVVFQDENHVVSAGSADGIIKVWDLRKTYTTLKVQAVPVDKVSHPQLEGRSYGYSHLLFDSTRARLFASCVNNQIYQFNMSGCNKEPVTTYQGHKNSFYVKTALSPDDLYLLSGSSDGNAHIWGVNDMCAYVNSRPLLLTGHTQEVSSVAWSSQDLHKLCTIADDCTVRIWRMARNVNANEPNDAVGSVERKNNVNNNNNKVSNLPSPNQRNVTAQYTNKRLSCEMKPIRWQPSRKVPSPLCSCMSKADNKLKAQANQNKLISKNWKSSKIMDFLKSSSGSCTVPKSPSKGPRLLVLKNRDKLQELSNIAELNVCKSDEPGCDLPISKGRKRKTSGTDTCSNKKARRLSENDENASSVSAVPISPAREGLESRVLGDITPTSKPQKAIFSHYNDDNHIMSDLTTPRKRELQNCDNNNYVSPTSNLPNSVLDPKPRTPRSRVAPKDGSKSVDWLTRMRINLNSPTSPSPTSSSPVDEQKTPKQSKKERGITPVKPSQNLSTRSPAMRKNITHYFSPCKE